MGCHIEFFDWMLDSTDVTWRLEKSTVFCRTTWASTKPWRRILEQYHPTRGRRTQTVNLFTVRPYHPAISSVRFTSTVEVWRRSEPRISPQCYTTVSWTQRDEGKFSHWLFCRWKPTLTLTIEQPQLIRVLSIILHFTPQETRRLMAKVWLFSLI